MDCMDVEFSADLVESALDHLRFLDNVDNFEKILKGDALQHGLKRYEQLWLPLAYTNREVKMVAPVDIGWFWYIHMLQPLAYRRDCRKIFKDTLNHEFPREKSIIPYTNNAIEIWYATYPKEGFNIIRNQVYVRPNRNKGQVTMNKPSKLSFDLVTYADSHMQFCYQVSLPHFRDKKYLESALKRYKQFLCLKRIEPNEFLTPSVDILLMWYTHMCNPVAYAKDMMKICGAILDNNIKIQPDLVNERFVLARQKTGELWKKVSKEELLQPGTTLRSNDNRKEIRPVTEADLKESCVVTYAIYLAHAQVTNLPKHIKHVDLEIFLVHKNTIMRQEVVSFSGARSGWTFSKSFSFNTMKHQHLHILLHRGSKFWCVSGDNAIADCYLDVRKEIEKMRAMERALFTKIDMNSTRHLGIKFELDGAVDQAIPVLCDLTLQKQPFTKQSLTSEQLWKTLGYARTSATDQEICYMATHSLTNHEDKDMWACRVVHIPQMLRSGVHVFFSNKLVATSRLIGSSQLPSPAQVQKGDVSMAFDPELGERAMLICNYQGDWGVCVARWNTGDTDSGAGLEVRFMKLTGKTKVQRTEVRRADIEFQSFNGNIYSGKVLINPAGNVVAENLALFWSISILYVLCSPGDHSREILLTGEPSDSGVTGENADLQSALNSDDEESKRPVYVQEKSCQFLLAAGLNTETPNNRYVRKTYGSLTYDLNMDAQDIFVEEQKTNKKLLKKDNKLSLSEYDGVSSDSPRKRKKRNSYLNESVSNLSLSDRTVENSVQESANDATSETAEQSAERTGKSVNDTNAIQPKDNVVVIKQKKVKKRQSSKLEDMLAMSDDSITKDEVETVKLVKDKRGRKAIIRKISSNLNEVVKPEDSFDEEEKEKEEFLGGLDVQRPEALEVQKPEALCKEQTTLIKDVVEKKKRDYAQNMTLDNGLAEVENDRVTFDLGDIDSIYSGKGGGGKLSGDDRSDTSSLTRENKALRKKISKERENLYPLTDEDKILSPRELDKKPKRKKPKRKAKEQNNEDTEAIKALYRHIAD